MDTGKTPTSSLSCNSSRREVQGIVRAIHLDRHAPLQISLLPIPCLDVPKMTTSSRAPRPQWIQMVLTCLDELHEQPRIHRQKSRARRALRRAPRSAWSLAAGDALFRRRCIRWHCPKTNEVTRRRTRKQWIIYGKARFCEITCHKTRRPQKIWWKPVFTGEQVAKHDLANEYDTKPDCANIQPSWHSFGHRYAILRHCGASGVSQWKGNVSICTAYLPHSHVER